MGWPASLQIVDETCASPRLHTLPHPRRNILIRPQAAAQVLALKPAWQSAFGLLFSAVYLGTALGPPRAARRIFARDYVPRQEFKGGWWPSGVLHGAKAAFPLLLSGLAFLVSRATAGSAAG